MYLPQRGRTSGTRTSDHMVHPTALAHLRRRSGFVNELLKNDSLLDMTNRRVVYNELLNWLELISSHDSLASMLAMPQMRPASEKPDPKFPVQQKIVTYEGAPSPRELLESCVIQAQAALKGLTKSVKTDEDEKHDEAEEARGREQLLRMTTAEKEADELKKQALLLEDDSAALKAFW